MIKYQVESFTDCIEELKPLLVSHWQELALDQAKVPLDPMWEVYIQKDLEGAILFVTVRDQGRLIGYFVGFVGPGLHYRTCKTLQMDIFWLHPEFREDSLSWVEGELISEELFKFLQSEAVKRDVQRIFVGSKLHRDASTLFERLGYVEVERYYSNWIGG